MRPIANTWFFGRLRSGGHQGCSCTRYRSGGQHNGWSVSQTHAPDVYSYLIIDLVFIRFGIGHSSYVYSGPSHRNLLQFADGTYQETVGQVQTNWTFASSECIPLIFEVLENCCSDVVLGDTILYDYNVFEDHAASILSYESLDSMLQLAPFDFVKNWQRNPSSLLPGHKNRKLRSASHLRQHKPNRQR